MNESFRLSASEKRKLQRGAYLPLLLILPMTAMFAFDSSKSQPSHFILTFTIGAIFSVIVVAIGRAGATNRVQALDRIVLSITDKQLVWASETGETAIEFTDVREVLVHKRGKTVVSIALRLQSGREIMLRSYDHMEKLERLIRQCVGEDRVVERGWLYI